MKFQKELPKEVQTWLVEIDTNRNIALYARQSTQAQMTKYKQSYELQTIDLKANAIDKFGFSDEQVREFFTDLGTSAVQANDARQGMKGLLEAIQKGEVGTVYVQRVDRLFRDKYAINAGEFAELCAQYGVMLLTYSGERFNFRNQDHVDMFLLSCRMAYRQYALNRQTMDAAHIRKSKAGGHDGRRLGIGYVWSEDGKEVIVYEVHARKIVWIFEQVRRHNFDIWKFYRDNIHGRAVFSLTDLDRTRFKTGASIISDSITGEIGYTLSYNGLRALLGNPIYIGYWMYKGTILDKRHHTAIVDEPLFWEVFQHVSPQDIDGTEIKHEKRFTRLDTPDCYCLLKGIIQSSIEQEECYTYYRRSADKWAYTLSRKQYSAQQVYFKASASDIDKMFVSSLFAILNRTEKFKDFQERMKEVDAEQAREKERLKAELRGIEGMLQGSLMTLQMPSIDKQTREELLEARKVHITRKEEINVLLNTKKNTGLSALSDYYELLQYIKNNWGSMPFEEKKYFIEKLCEKVTLEDLTPHFFKMVIYWNIADTEELLLYRPQAGGNDWTVGEDMQLKDLYASATPETILNTLPDRTWLACCKRARILGVKRIAGYAQPKYPALSVSDHNIFKKNELDYSLTDNDQMKSIHPSTSQTSFCVQRSS